MVAAVVDGTITAICTDHQPHEPEAKLTPFSESEPGTSSLEVLLPLALATGKQTQMSLATTISMLTYGPARVLNIEAGEILGVGRSNMKMIIFRARKRIAAAMGKAMNGQAEPASTIDLAG